MQTDKSQHNLSIKDAEHQPHFAAADTASERDGVSEDEIDPLVVKRFKRKADLMILPVLAIAYLLNSLDRSNVSNANTAGLEKDLHMVGNQFNQVLTWYQIPFVICGPLFTVFTKSFGAKYVLSGMLLAFGAASFATGWATTYNHLIVCRVLVGTFESGFLASNIYYLSIWYTRRELASRVGFFYAALTASSAFGGLLAYGMFQVKPRPGYFQWSYLFVVEGSLTLAWSIAIFFLLPKNTQTAWFLSKEEKEAAALRLQRDSVQTLNTTFQWDEALLEFKSPHGYIRLILNFPTGVILNSNANFLAMIVKRLGRGTVQTQLYTVAPALTGAIILFFWCKSSDLFRERGFHATASNLLSLLGYILLTTVDTTRTGIIYLAIFFCTIGAYPAVPIGSSWTVSNIPNLNARALLSGVYISVGNCGGFVTSNIYLSSEAPRYITALRINIAMCVIAAAGNVCYALWMRWENKRRDRVYGKADGSTTDIMSSKDPRFRFQF